MISNAGDKISNDDIHSLLSEWNTLLQLATDCTK